MHAMHREIIIDKNLNYQDVSNVVYDKNAFFYLSVKYFQVCIFLKKKSKQASAEYHKQASDPIRMWNVQN